MKKTIAIHYGFSDKTIIDNIDSIIPVITECVEEYKLIETISAVINAASQVCLYDVFYDDSINPMFNEQKPFCYIGTLFNKSDADGNGRWGLYKDDSVKIAPRLIRPNIIDEDMF